jgi:hypothetical protein
MESDTIADIKPRLHPGEYRDTSARPPVRYSSQGKLIGSITNHCEMREHTAANNSTCQHLKFCPLIIPHSHWSCCGGIDRASAFCIQSPHPGEFRDSSAKPSKRYSSFHDYVGKIRQFCCSEDCPDEGLRCAHLNNSDEIINRSHWSCCGNTEKYSISCLVRPDASLPSTCTKAQRAKTMRSFSETFDPEVDSEFTEYDCNEFSESDLSIEEYNDGPVVWSPSSSDRKSLDSKDSLLNIKSLTILENENCSKDPIPRSALRSPPASTDLKAAPQSIPPSFSPATLQRIKRLNALQDKLVHRGFSVNFSRLRSRLGVPLAKPPSELSENTRPSVRLPDISEDLDAASKVTETCSHHLDALTCDDCVRLSFFFRGSQVDLLRRCLAARAARLPLKHPLKQAFTKTLLW